MNRADKVRGFTLLELMLVLAVLGVISAMAIPAVLNTTRQIKLAANARAVERELQGARMKAVRSNRAIRVRFNCPATGQYRIVESLGSKQTPRDRRRRFARGDPMRLQLVPVPGHESGLLLDPEQRRADSDAAGRHRLRHRRTDRGVLAGRHGARRCRRHAAVARDSGDGVGITVFDIMHQSTIVTSIGVNGLGKIALH